MKKIILKSSYFIHLLCFNVLASILLPELLESVLSSFKIDETAYFGISYLVLVLFNIFLSYFYAKVRIGKKTLIILTIAGVAIKILLFLLWAQEGFSEVEDDKMGIFMVAIVYGYFAYIESLDVIFLIGLGVNLLIRRKNEDKKLDS
ncbi:hypothetical protein [Leptotrichia wadei]|uniref:Uncharacterized protein n=1 Tax=Leptotrichia wadei (strain F0279) TaxID=888055 RepID=U2RD50_LEPWF|nr:hypothetical protein [Leptotrichia wadei]ERK51478.1 hypothetical protein HMPREF9015_01107 [Leptotrichia wadei F0279]